MRSDQVRADGFTVRSASDGMIGDATVYDRKRVDVNATGFDRGSDDLLAITSKMRGFAEAEARRLGMLDE